VGGLNAASPEGCHRQVLHKKTTIRSANGVRIEGSVMVHRTDIAGASMGQASLGQASLGQASPGQASPGQASPGQASSGDDGMRWRALNGAPLENNFSLSDNKCCRLLMTVFPPVHAIYLELPTL
jgi:hypothetical protein